jgi:ectoine hydroxylase-related dioxygenase (phytanoyl-CoA dioxygenase family)
MDAFNLNGFEVINAVYTVSEIEEIITVINQNKSNKATFRKSADLFAIRQFLKEIPACIPLLFNTNLQNLLSSRFGKEYFVVKSIYFDKPAESNWFVAYHQDLTISVDKKMELEGFGPWTTKQNQFAVQPPSKILEDNFTIRIHLDSATSENGALRVIPGSHTIGILRSDEIKQQHLEQTCSVEAGGVMLMKPLLLHASGRTINNRQRRVVHLEFSRTELPQGLNWSEKQSIPLSYNS